MATANGADFSTQCYRHGVLIGNWHEDQAGCDILHAASSASSLPPASGTQLFYPETTTHASYQTSGHDVVTQGVFEGKTKMRSTAEVPRSLLFPHKGAGGLDSMYQTSYLSSFAPAGTQPGVDRTVAKTKAAAEGNLEEGAREQSRFRTYRTASSDAYNPSSSILAQSTNALQAEKSAAAIYAPNARAGALAHSLEANYRKLRLRKD